MGKKIKLDFGEFVRFLDERKMATMIFIEQH